MPRLKALANGTTLGMDTNHDTGFFLRYTAHPHFYQFINKYIVVANVAA
jgi:hypothetical protein